MIETAHDSRSRRTQHSYCVHSPRVESNVDLVRWMGLLHSTSVAGHDGEGGMHRRPQVNVDRDVLVKFIMDMTRRAFWKIHTSLEE